MSSKEYAFIILGGPMLLAVLIFLGGCKTLDDLKDKLPDIKPPIQTTPTTTTTTTTTQPPIVAKDKCVEPPVSGGECVNPSGLDVRFDVWSPKKKDYIFAGNLLKKYVKITRNAEGTYRLEMPDVVVDGVVYRCEAYNFPSSATEKIKGNICESWGKNGTFRFWIKCYEVAK
jgi:hypothetical protein